MKGRYCEYRIFVGPPSRCFFEVNTSFLALTSCAMIASWIDEMPHLHHSGNLMAAPKHVMERKQAFKPCTNKCLSNAFVLRVGVALDLIISNVMESKHQRTGQFEMLCSLQYLKQTIQAVFTINTSTAKALQVDHKRSWSGNPMKW